MSLNNNLSKIYFCQSNIDLLQELINLRPHWKEDIYRFENTQIRILYYFYRCCKSSNMFIGGDFYEYEKD